MTAIQSPVCFAWKWAFQSICAVVFFVGVIGVDIHCQILTLPLICISTPQLLCIHSGRPTLAPLALSSHHTSPAYPITLIMALSPQHFICDIF